MVETEATKGGMQPVAADAECPVPNRAVAPETTGCGLAGRARGGSRGALWGWSPPSRPADTALQRLVDGVLPRTGVPAVLYFAAVIGLLSLAHFLPTRSYLVADALAALAAGSWCGLNFWRCRHAHCLVSGAGWLGLSALAFVEAGLGRSFIGGDEQLVFLGVLVAALLFEAAWSLAYRTNAIAPNGRRSRTTRR